MLQDAAPARITRRLPYVQIITAVLGDLSISRDARLLFAVLAQYADLADRTAYPGRKALAVEMGAEGKPVSTKSITRWMQELQDAGYVRVDADYRGDGSQKSNVYTLLDAPDLPTTAADRKAALAAQFDASLDAERVWQVRRGQQIRDGRASEGRDPWVRASGE